MEDVIATEKQAWDDYKELCMLVKNDIRSVLRKGQLLKTLRDTERYKKLGDGGYETFNSFLNDPELKISRSYAFQHIQMFDFYIEDLHLPVEEVEKIASIKLMRDCMSFILGKNLSDDQALEVITKAQTLSYGDFFKEMTGTDELPQQAIEGQVQEPAAQITATGEQQREQEEYQKPRVTRCDMCNHSQIEYFEDQICNCGGKPHVINKSQEARDQQNAGAIVNDYQHESTNPNAIEGGDE